MAQAKNSTKNGKEKLDLNLTENDFKSKCIVGQAGEALEVRYLLLLLYIWQIKKTKCMYIVNTDCELPSSTEFF